MDRKQTLKLAAAILLAGFVLLSTAMADDYEILLTRPAPVGQKVQISGTARDSEKTVLSGAVSRTTENVQDVRLKAVLEVLEVDNTKRPCKVRLVIDTLVLKNNGKEAELLAKGTKVLARSGEKGTVFEVDGKPVGKEVDQGLSLLLSVDGNSKRPTDDEMFGSKTRRRVGEHWPVNSQSLAASLRVKGMDIRNEDVAGTITLKEVVKDGRGTSLLLTMKMDMRNLKMPGAEGLSVENASGTVTISVLVPVDPAKGILKESQEGSRTIRAKGFSQDGMEIAVESVGKARHAIEYTYPASSKQE
jgi:flavin-binding protein dodecin